MEEEDDDDEKGIRSCIVAKKRIPAEFFCFSLNSFLFSGVLLSRNNKTALASRFGVANKAWQEEK